MTRLQCLSPLAFGVVLAVLAAPALAAPQRTFVSTGGNDAHPCSLTLPCRGFAAAVAAVASGGEVVALDSGGYGVVTIGKAVSIIAPTGVYVGITVPGGKDGITLNAPGATVVLRGLSINGQGGNLGINVVAVAHLRIEGCVISNMASNGVADYASGSTMIIVDSIVRDTAGTGIGIAADATVLLDRVRSVHNGFDGFYIVPSTAAATATITDSVFADNGVNGINIDSISGAKTYAQIEHATISGNGANGISATGQNFDGRVFLTLARSSINRNIGDGVLLTASTPAFASGFISENAIQGNAGNGVHLHGASTFLAAYAKVSGNTLQGNANLDLYCDDSTQFLLSLKNNSVSTASGVSACLSQINPF